MIIFSGLAYYKNMTIVILDTEGLMSLEESGSIFDNQMVTMAVLSSNLVIVNHKGEISSSLEGLIGMSLYAKIQIQSSPFKPKLLFVLRDQTQRDMKIFQQQLNRLKENIQTNGDFLRMSIDDELEMKHVVLMPGAFTEDTNRDYGIVQKWRTETFAVEINKLRTTVFKSLDEQMNETANIHFLQRRLSNTTVLRKNFDRYLYSKLTTNWKSIDELGEGLLRCQSLYELSVENELKSISGSIIATHQNQLQKRGSDLIENLIQTNNQQMHEINGLKPHVWIQQTVKKGILDLNKIIDEQIEEVQIDYNEQTQSSHFTKAKSQWKNIEGSLKNMKQYLYEQLEMRALETALKTIQDYYRRELFDVKETSKTSKECTTRLDQRVQELRKEITDSLQAYKRNKDDIIKSILDVYKNVIQMKNANKNRHSTYNICPPLDYSKYLDASRQLNTIINQYVNPYIEQTGHHITSPEITAANSSWFVSKQDDRSVIQWFNNFDERSKIERTIKFVFNELLAGINDRLDMSLLHLSYSDPKMVDELIEFIDYQLHSAKVDMSHINRPVFVQDLIIFMLYLFHEKTNQRFELKNKQLLDGTLNDLNQVKQNVLDQINEDAIGDQQAKLFRQIVGKEIIREVERIYRQTFLEEIRSKIFQYCPIDPTDITRQIYFESINSWPVNPTNILKLVSDPEHYCLQKVNSRIKDLFHQFIRIYSDEINTNVTSCMLIMRDVVLHSDWTDVYELHKRVLREVSYYKKD
jgi:hypothetical protein